MAGRPRQFDENEVLDAAMQVFWANGYEATSMSDLVSATGLLRGSIYQAFGDKHNLFLQSLRLYLQKMRRQITEVVEQSPTPLDGIRNALRSMVDIADADSQFPCGCMAVNTLVELVPTDDAVRTVMMENQKGMVGMLTENLSTACSSGQLTLTRTPEQTVSLLMTFMVGLAASMKGPLNKAEAHQLLDLQFDALL